MFLYLSDTIRESTSYLVVELVPIDIFHISILASRLIALMRTESKMGTICLRRTYKPGIAVRITAVLAVICEFICIETLPYRRMRTLISDLSRNSPVERIEIAEPIPVVELVDILYDSTLYRVELCVRSLISKYGCLLTADTTSTVPDNFFSLCCLTILLDEFRYFTEVHRPCGDSILEVSETILVVIAHIEDEIVIRLS